MSLSDKWSVKDYDGNSYPVVHLGGQLWMGANLNVHHFSNGDPIPECCDVVDYAMAGQKGEPARCYYDNLTENGSLYGSLYNWFAAHDPRGIAPKGWRLPTEKDWSVLEAYCKEQRLDARFLKNKSSWGIAEAAEAVGFNALPGGSRGINGAFGGLGINGYWWSYLPSPPTLSWGRKINKFHEGVEPIDSFQRFGFSIRCVKDNSV